MNKAGLGEFKGVLTDSFEGFSLGERVLKGPDRLDVRWLITVMEVDCEVVLSIIDVEGFVDGAIA